MQDWCSQHTAGKFVACIANVHAQQHETLPSSGLGLWLCLLVSMLYAKHARRATYSCTPVYAMVLWVEG